MEQILEVLILIDVSVLAVSDTTLFGSDGCWCCWTRGWCRGWRGWWAAKNREEVFTCELPDGGLRDADIWRAVADTAAAQKLEHVAEPVEELATADVRGLPPPLQEAAPSAE